MKRYWSLDPLPSYRALLDPVIADAIDAEVSAEVAGVLTQAREALPSSWSAQ